MNFPERCNHAFNGNVCNRVKDHEGDHCAIKDICDYYVHNDPCTCGNYRPERDLYVLEAYGTVRCFCGGFL